MARSSRKFDRTRQLTRGDISVTDSGLRICIKWEKNMQSSLGTQYVVLPYTRDPYFCPVAAFRRMILLSPTSRGRDALIQFKDANHMPIYFVQKLWNLAVRRIGRDPKKLRMHGLRRGGATHIATSSKGASAQLKSYGRWRSQIYMKYIADPKASHVYQAMARI